jgi:hypothetical protein
MGSHIEWTTGILRMGRKFDKWGDPYEFACSCIREGDTLIFCGAAAECSMSIVSERQRIRELLAPMGITKVRWTRRKDGKVKEVEIKL